MKMLVFPLLAALLAVGLCDLLGAPVDIDVNEAKDALDFAVAKHNRRTNDLFLRQVAEVVRVQRQLVSGYKYIITVKMAKTPCRKDSVENEVCSIHKDPALAQPYVCTFTVWSRPWQSSLQLLEERC